MLSIASNTHYLGLINGRKFDMNATYEKYCDSLPIHFRGSKITPARYVNQRHVPYTNFMAQHRIILSSQPPLDIQFVRKVFISGTLGITIS